MTKSVIVGAARTPIGSFGGALSKIPAPKLGSIAIKAAIERAGISKDQVDQVIMGNVLTAGEGQAPARQATIFAGLPESTGAVTINKVCGSGLFSVMMADMMIRCGEATVVVAGGMENMSQAPYLLDKARSGYRLGHGTLVDSMIKDGLWDVYNDFHMGNAAELCSREMNISRQEQDEFAKESYLRSQKAIKEGLFVDEIVPVEVPQKKGDPVVVDTDEEPMRGKIEKLPALRPAFEKDGTVTAGNASSINDGAAAVVVVSEEFAKQHNLPILATIVGHTTHSQKPEWFTIAPAGAIEKLLKRFNLSKEEIDLYEINEAFSVVSCAVNKKLDLDPSKVNVHGGAVSLGHPIGASGTRILVTLLYAMKRYDKKRGIASLCIGGGEAVAMLVER